MHRVLPAPRRLLRHDEPRRHRVHPNAVRRPGDRQRLRQLRHRRLRRAIGRVPRAPEGGVHRRDVDDAPARRLQMRMEGRRRAEGPVEVDVHHLLEEVGRHLLAPRGDRGAVHEDIEPRRLPGQPRDRRLVLHVELTVGGARDRHHRLRLDPRDPDRRPGLDEGRRDRRPDPAPAPADDKYLATREVESHRAHGRPPCRRCSTASQSRATGIFTFCETFKNF